MVLAGQYPHQPVGEIVEIVQPLAQIRVGGAQHARAGVGLHALDAGFGGEAGHHGLADLMQPALVVGEHAIGFEHVAVLAALGEVAVLDQPIEVGAQGGDGGVDAPGFALHVVGDDIGDDHARLVQHHMAKRDAVRQRGAGNVRGVAGGGLCAGARQ